MTTVQLGNDALNCSLFCTFLDLNPVRTIFVEVQELTSHTVRNMGIIAGPPDLIGQMHSIFLYQAGALPLPSADLRNLILPKKPNAAEADPCNNALHSCG